MEQGRLLTGRAFVVGWSGDHGLDLSLNVLGWIGLGSTRANVFETTLHLCGPGGFDLGFAVSVNRRRFGALRSRGQFGSRELGNRERPSARSLGPDRRCDRELLIRDGARPPCHLSPAAMRLHQRSMGHVLQRDRLDQAVDRCFVCNARL